MVAGRDAGWVVAGRDAGWVVAGRDAGCVVRREDWLTCHRASWQHVRLTGWPSGAAQSTVQAANKEKANLKIIVIVMII